MRRKMMAGNWKMNKTTSEAVEFIQSIKDTVNTADSDVVLCVPFVSLESAVEAVTGTHIGIGAQNMYFEEFGAYTGEISPSMLKDLGVKYVIIGHSERRAYFAETDDIVNKKTKKALQHELIPIVCVGETLEQREQNITLDLISIQTKTALCGLTSEEVKKVVIAYEPIWAIGTGKTATKEQAEEVCRGIRNVVKSIYDAGVAENIQILYGGSVTADNANELFRMPNIDGGLVGGASLKQDFVKIVNYK